MTISARNQVASGHTRASMFGPEMAKAPVLKHRGPLFSTNWVLPRLECNPSLGAFWTGISPARKGFVQMEYTIPAIPTVYRGRQYRSRLEARWAAFFDMAGFSVEYEPCDLGHWSPDFALSHDGERAYLVEIKPIQQFDEPTSLKMTRDFSRLFPRSGGLLLLGSDVNAGWKFWVDSIRIPSEPKWQPVRLAWMICENEPVMIPFFAWEGMGDHPKVRLYPEYVEELWVEAANVVQWKGPRS